MGSCIDVSSIAVVVIVNLIAVIRADADAVRAGVAVLAPDDLSVPADGVAFVLCAVPASAYLAEVTAIVGVQVTVIAFLPGVVLGSVVQLIVAAKTNGFAIGVNPAFASDVHTGLATVLFVCVPVIAFFLALGDAIPADLADLVRELKFKIIEGKLSVTVVFRLVSLVNNLEVFRLNLEVSVVVDLRNCSFKVLSDACLYPVLSLLVELPLGKAEPIDILVKYACADTVRRGIDHQTHHS